MNYKKRLAALERAMAPEGYVMGQQEEESLNKLPLGCKEMLKRAISGKFTSVRQEEAAALDAAIQVLPKLDRARILKLAEGFTILAFSETDWLL
jgi:hypothetical protein